VTAPPPVVADPGREHERRRAERRGLEARALARAERLSGLRLAVFALGLGLAVALGPLGLPVHVLWVPVAAFVLLVVLHQRARRVAFEAGALAALSERALERIEDRWAGRGSEGREHAPEKHLYAEDLDVFGPGSLFQLLSTARTRAGGACLARWLLAPAPAAEVRSRQEAARELAPCLDLRETLALTGGEVSSRLEREQATAWGGAPIALGGRWMPRVAAVLGLASAVLLVGWTFFGWGVRPLAATLLLQALWTLPTWTRVSRVLEHAERPGRDLDLVARILEVLERGSFGSPWLSQLAAGIRTSEGTASARIRRLGLLLDFVEARRNQVFLPLSWLLCLGTQLAYAVERWRERNGSSLGAWLDAAGAFEAIVSVAGYVYEHPDDPFPEVVESGAVFEAEALGHPLIPRARCVANDVRLEAPAADGAPQALLVSGSNMSGKSTLLRAVGVAAVLAQAGAPVRARRLRLSPLEVGASLSVHDSLQAGESRFYAEISRLGAVVQRARAERKVLFLLDEVLGGTNSHDRRVGAEAIVRSLLAAGAIGLVTTHDLALAEIAEADDRLVNVHFEDTIEEGRIRFDYRLKPGVVTRSNALALMRAVGLDV
jgi:hypothetical protein